MSTVITVYGTHDTFKEMTIHDLYCEYAKWNFAIERTYQRILTVNWLTENKLIKAKQCPKCYYPFETE